MPYDDDLLMRGKGSKVAANLPKSIDDQHSGEHVQNVKNEVCVLSRGSNKRKEERGYCVQGSLDHCVLSWRQRIFKQERESGLKDEKGKAGMRGRGHFRERGRWRKGKREAPEVGEGKSCQGFLASEKRGYIRRNKMGN
jgi:hypothetical protein